jgi:hypothetical protein
MEKKTLRKLMLEFECNNAADGVYKISGKSVSGCYIQYYSEPIFFVVGMSAADFDNNYADNENREFKYGVSQFEEYEANCEILRIKHTDEETAELSRQVVESRKRLREEYFERQQAEEAAIKAIKRDSNGGTGIRL